MNLLPITFAFLGLFNYASAQQAAEACKKWVANGPTFEQSYKQSVPRYTHEEAEAAWQEATDRYRANPETCSSGFCISYIPLLTDYTDRVVYETRTRSSPLRYCKLESVTNQWLGFQRDSEEDSKGTVRKHFRF